MDPLQEIERLTKRIDLLEDDKKALINLLDQQSAGFSDEFQMHLLETKEDLEHKISILEEEIETLKNDKKELESKVIKQDYKIACLDIENEERDKKIKDLERQDKMKEQKVTFLEYRVVHLNSDKDVLSRKIREKDDTLKHMQNYFDKKYETLMTTVNNLEGEVKSVKAKSRDQEHALEKYKEDLDTYKARTEDLEKTINVLYIAQLFRTLTEEIYREVLPEFFRENGKLKKEYQDKILLEDLEMEKNIEMIHETKEKKDEIKEIWKEKKDELGPELMKYMKDVRKKRNENAHRLLRKPELQEIATKMPLPYRSLIERAIELLCKKSAALSIPFYFSV